VQRNDLAIIDFLLNIYPEAASKSNGNGVFSLHLAVRYHSLALIDRLLKMHPEAATMMTSRGMNVLHYVVDCRDKKAIIIATYICTQYPTLIHERTPLSGAEYTPFLLALTKSDFKIASAICQINKQVIRDVVDSAHAWGLHKKLSNSLHIMVEEFSRRKLFKPVSEGADCFRLFISILLLPIFFPSYFF
jgi:hypothetical protein